MVRIARLAETDWPLLRELRLFALSDSPLAFWATWVDENCYGSAQWTDFIRNVVWFIALRDDHPVGLVGCLRRPECPDEPEVIGMWVRAEDRGSGTADTLLLAAFDWARDQRVDALSLWIVSTNERARRFFQRHHFHPTGERTPLPEGRVGHEERLRREWEHKGETDTANRTLAAHRSVARPEEWQ